MARSPNEKVEKAHELYREGMKLVDITAKLDVPAGTMRRWKRIYQWDDERKSEHLQKKKACVQKLSVQKNNCIYYVRCFNATKAYQKAYQTDYATAMTGGSRLLGKDKIKREIMHLKQDRLNREFFSEEDIFQKYINIAYADITDFTEFGSKEIEIPNSEAGESKKVMVS